MGQTRNVISTKDFFAGQGSPVRAEMISGDVSFLILIGDDPCSYLF